MLRKQTADATASEPLWRATLHCADCGEVLNTAEHVPESEKSRVSMASPLVAGRCPKGCRSTLSDLNMNTRIVWTREEVMES